MRVLFTLLLAMFALHARADERVLSCGEISDLIYTRGPDTVLAELWANHERLFAPVTAKIATGESCWLGVAFALKAGADAGSSKELEGAMSRALAVHPERVLPYLAGEKQRFPLDVVCEGVQIAVDEEEPAVRAWLRKTENALQRTTGLSPSNKRKRERCQALVRRKLGSSLQMRPN